MIYKFKTRAGTKEVNVSGTRVRIEGRNNEIAFCDVVSGEVMMARFPDYLTRAEAMLKAGKARMNRERLFDLTPYQGGVL